MIEEENDMTVEEAKKVWLKPSRFFDWVDRTKEAHWYTEDPLVSMKYTSIKENKKHGRMVFL